MLVDIELVLDELVLELLLEIGPFTASLRQSMDHIHHKMEAIQIVENRHIERRRDRAFFLVAAYMEVLMVRTAIREPVDQPRVGVEGEDDRLAGFEVVAGIGWVTVVFAVILAYLQPRFTAINTLQQAQKPEDPKVSTKPADVLIR